MKIRSVRPEFFADPTMVELDPMARLLYIGLWCFVDDEGRGEWLPKLIEGSIFPLEDVDIHALLAQLVRSARVVRYTDGDREYFHVPTFSQHQKPNRKYESKLPSPEECRQLSTSSADAVRAQRARMQDAPPGEGGGEGGGEGVVAPIPKPARERNPVWDAMSEVFGEPETKTARSLRGKCVSELTVAGADGDEILRRARMWPLHFESATLTETALTKHWTTLARPPLRASPMDVERAGQELRRAQRTAELEKLERGADDSG